MTPMFAPVFVAAVIISVTLFSVLIQQTKDKPDKKTGPKKKEPETAFPSRRTSASAS